MEKMRSLRIELVTTMTKSADDVFDLDTLVGELKSASRDKDAATLVKSIMDRTFANPENVAQHIPEFAEDDVVLFEDDNISIWHCRFQPGMAVPPHDHQVSATIGVYAGVERNIFYKSGGRGIEYSSEVVMVPGSVLSIGPTAIHSVECTSEEPSCGIHVYGGPLTRIERHLFDLQAGERLPFTDEAYERLKQAAESKA